MGEVNPDSSRPDDGLIFRLMVDGALLKRPGKCPEIPRKRIVPSYAKCATCCAILCQTQCHLMPNGNQQFRGFSEGLVPSNAELDKIVVEFGIRWHDLA